MALLDRRFVKKLLAEFGLTGGEDLTGDELIRAIDNRAKEMEQARSTGAVSPEVLGLLELPRDATKAEIIRAIRELKARAEMDERVRDEVIARLIDAACLPGDGDLEGKLWPEEKEWAIGEMKKDPPAFIYFLKYREKVTGAQQGDIQDEINRQVGVSKEMFLKYNN
jgi:hypothetical protein